jgi:glucokinase
MTVLGIDIGGSQIKAGRVNERGDVLASVVVPTPTEPIALQAALHRVIAELTADERPAGVGIGCKGIIDPLTTKVEILPGAMHFLEGRLLADLVRPPLAADTPVYADNDARVALVGESVWGAARGARDAIMLTLGSGVGGAVISGGVLLRGHRGVAGHLGHVTIDPDGPLCICGNQGCLETYFSGYAIEAEARGGVHRGCDSSLTRRFRNCPEQLTCQAVFTAAAEDDNLARLVVDSATHKLAGAVAGLVHVFDPELVILGGQIVEAGAAVLEPVRREVAWRTRVMLGREVPVVPQQVTHKPGIAGAAALALRPAWSISKHPDRPGL